MPKWKPNPLHAALALGLTLCLAAPTGAAASDASDSMRVGDLQYGNALDPSGWAALLAPDPRGFSWLHAGMMRTPTGALYPYPPLRDAVLPGPSGWTHQGIVQFGYLHTSGNDQAQFFRQYADWKSGAVLGLLGMDFEKPESGSYVQVRANHLSTDDQFLRVRAGRYGHYKVQAFYRDMPHMVASNAYPFWDGAGGTYLSVPDGTTAGDTPPAQVAAVEATRPRQAVKLVRTRRGLSLEGKLHGKWIGFASVVNEKRTGTRLWGGPMFFNYPFADNGGALETVRPIDFSTTDVNLGLRFVGKTWHFNSIYTGSFFRNHKDHVDFESPFKLSNVVGVPSPADIYLGEFSLEPDNDYHNLRLELSRSLKWNGELSMAAAYGTMRQNDALRAPVTCTGTGGFMIAPPADYTFNCADWNTTDALSRTTGDARIDTGLLYVKTTFRPSPKFGWHAQLRWYKEDNKTRYLAYNPLTGQYGYISENGAQGTVVPGELGIFDPSNPLYQSAVVPVRNVPFAYTDTKLELGANWRVSRHNTLDLTYTFDHDQPKHRERKRVDEHRLKLSWSNRKLGKGTLRASYAFARRTGDRYNYDPYDMEYSYSLPGFVMPPEGLAAHTVEQMRKYDLSDRTENKFHLMLTWPLGDTATLSTTLHGTWDHYGATIGRQQMRNTGATVQWDWQPNPLTNVSAWLGAEDMLLKLAGVADNEAALGAPGQDDASLGGIVYPWENRWWDTDKERDYNLGLTWAHTFGRVRADLSYNFTLSRSVLDYQYASPSAVSGTQQPFIGNIGMGFPDGHYRTNTVDLGFTFQLAERIGMRLFGRYQMGGFLDWHYLGLAQTPTVDHRIYTDRGPMRRYHAALVGAMVNVKL